MKTGAKELLRILAVLLLLCSAFAPAAFARRGRPGVILPPPDEEPIAEPDGISR